MLLADSERVIARPERLQAAVYGDEQATHDMLMEAARAAREWGTDGRYELVVRPVSDEG